MEEMIVLVICDTAVLKLARHTRPTTQTIGQQTNPLLHSVGGGDK